MKRNTPWLAVFVLSLLTMLIVVVSGCGGSNKVQAQSFAATSLIFGTSAMGPPVSPTTTVFIQTRIGDLLNTDVLSIPMPSHAVLGHLQFITNANTLSSATGVVSVYVNGVPSTVTCNVNPGAMTCSDTIHTVMVNEGDLVTIGATVPASSGGVGSLGPFRASAGITFE